MSVGNQNVFAKPSDIDFQPVMILAKVHPEFTVFLVELNSIKISGNMQLAALLLVALHNLLFVTPMRTVRLDIALHFKQSVAGVSAVSSRSCIAAWLQ